MRIHIFISLQILYPLGSYRTWNGVPGAMQQGLVSTCLCLAIQYFGHLMPRVDSLEKTDAGRDWGQEEKGTAEDEMAGWHHQLNGHEFE